jgi:hypothetical protein
MLLFFPQRSIINTKRVITVSNEKGLSAIDAIENYNKKTTVRDEAYVYMIALVIERIKREKILRTKAQLVLSTLFSE